MIINPDWSNIVERIPLGNRMFCESHLVKMKEPHKSRHVSPREKKLKNTDKTCIISLQKTSQRYPIPSGKRLHNYGKSPFSMGKSIINGHFQWLCNKLPEGKSYILKPLPLGTPEFILCPGVLLLSASNGLADSGKLV